MPETSEYTQSALKMLWSVAVIQWQRQQQKPKQNSVHVQWLLFLNQLLLHFGLTLTHVSRLMESA